MYTIKKNIGNYKTLKFMNDHITDITEIMDQYDNIEKLIDIYPDVTLRYAIIIGDLNYVKIFCEINTKQIINSCVKIAIENKRIDIVKFLHSYGCEIKISDLQLLTSRNILELVEYFWNQGYDFSKCTYIACVHCLVDIFKYLHQHDVDASEHVSHMIISACYNQNLDIIKYICDHNIYMDIDSALEISIYNYSHDIVNYLITNGANIYNISLKHLFKYAIHTYNNELINYIIETDFSIIVDNVILFNNISEEECLNLIKHIHRNNIDIINEYSIWSVKNDKFLVISYLYEYCNEKNIRRLLVLAVRMKKIDTVIFLHRMGADIHFNNYKLLRNSANSYSCCTKMMKYFCEHGSDIYVNNCVIFKLAIDNKKLSMVKYLHNLDPFVYIDNALYLKNAIITGYIPVILFLLQNGASVINLSLDDISMCDDNVRNILEKWI